MNTQSSRLRITPDLRLPNLRPDDPLDPEDAVRLGMGLIRAAVRRVTQDEAGDVSPTRRDRRGVR